MNNLNSKNFLFFIKILTKSLFFKKIQLLEILNIEFTKFNKLFNLLQYKLVSPLYNSEFFISYYPQNFTQISLTSVFCSSLWLEREVYDMYGIIFLYHPDLRRLLTDYGFLGYPLQKSFPCIGYKELFYNYNFFKVSWYNINI